MEANYFPDFRYWILKNHIHHYNGINSGLYVSWDRTGSANKVMTELELLKLYIKDKQQ